MWLAPKLACLAAAVLAAAGGNLCAAPIPASDGDTASRETALAGFQTFWTRFREGVLSGNTNQVGDLTLFPFKTRGILDGSAERTVTRDAFPAVLGRLLKEDTGLKEQSQTMWQSIRETRQPAAKVLNNNGDMARVGIFAFQKIKGQWRFVRAYVND